MEVYYVGNTPYSSELYHHGILGQKWGVTNGPPYPLGSGDHSSKEIKRGYKKSHIGKRNTSMYKNPRSYREDPKKTHHDKVAKIQESNMSEKEKSKAIKKENNSFNKKQLTEQQKKIIKRTLLIAGGVTVTAAAAYGIYKYKAKMMAKPPNIPINQTAFDNIEGLYKSTAANAQWLEGLSNSGAFGEAKLFFSGSLGDNYAFANIWSSSWWKNLSPSMREAVKSYTGSGYRDMNMLLRTGDTSLLSNFTVLVEKDINNLTNALKQASLKVDVVSHRGVGSISSLAKTLGVPEDILKDPTMAKSLIGNSFIDKAFGSTAISVSDAWSGTKLHMFLPKGTQAMYVDPISSVKGEHEVLINRGAQYIIKDIRIGSNGTVSDVFVELVRNVL